MALKLQKGPGRCFLWLNETRQKGHTEVPRVEKAS